MSTSGFFNAAGAAINEQLPYGKIIVIKRSGQDSASFDLLDSSYLFGRSESCDIRIQIPSVSEEHCRVYWDGGLGLPQVQCLSAAGVTVHRGNEEVKVRVGESVVLRSMDVITIVERSFRYETVPNMRQKSVSSLPGTPSKKPATPARTFEVQELPAAQDNVPKIIAPPAHLLSPQQPSAIAVMSSPLKQGAVRTPMKANPAASFVMSPLGMPAVREPLPASPLKQPAQRPGFTESTIQSEQEIQKTPKKSSVFTEINITPSKENTSKKNQTPVKKTPVKEEKAKTLIKVKTPIKEESKMIEYEVFNEDVESEVAEIKVVEQVCTPVAQTKDLERITPSTPRMTPRSLDLDNPAVKSPALQVDHEVTTSPRLSPRVTLIDCNNNGAALCSPLQQHSKGLSPEQRELLMSPEINKIISASKPLNVLSPSAVAVDARELADVDSPTKQRGPLSVHELLLMSESTVMKPFEKRDEREEEFSLPITQELEQLHQRNSPQTEGYKVELVDQQIEAQIGTVLVTSSMEQEIDTEIVEPIQSQEEPAQEKVVEECDQSECLNGEAIQVDDVQEMTDAPEVQNIETMQVDEQSTTLEEVQQEVITREEVQLTGNVESVQTEETTPTEKQVIEEAEQVIEQPIISKINNNEQVQVVGQLTAEAQICEAMEVDEQYIQQEEVELQVLENTKCVENAQEIVETAVGQEAPIISETTEVAVYVETFTNNNESIEITTTTQTTEVINEMQVDEETIIEQPQQAETMTKTTTTIIKEQEITEQQQIIEEQVIQDLVEEKTSTEVNEPMETEESEQTIIRQEHVTINVENNASVIEEETSQEVHSEDVNNEGEIERPTTPRRSSRVRKSITPLSPSHPMTPRSAKRTKLSTVVNATTTEEGNTVQVSETIVTTESTEKQSEITINQEQDHQTENEQQQNEEEKEETTLRRSTRARTPRTQPTTSTRKSASTTKKRAASALKEQEVEDDNSPLLRRRPMPVAEEKSNVQDEEDENKENANKRQAIEKKVIVDSAADEEGMSTPQRALRRSTRVSSAKK